MAQTAVIMYDLLSLSRCQSNECFETF